MKRQWIIIDSDTLTESFEEICIVTIVQGEEILFDAGQAM